MRRQVVRAMIAVALLVNLQGCAAVALTLLSAGASVGGSAGIDYTMNGAATRTFTAGHDQLRGAVLTTLRRMAITVKADASTDEGRKIVAQAIDRDRKSTRLNSSHRCISYAVFCLKKKK